MPSTTTPLYFQHVRLKSERRSCQSSNTHSLTAVVMRAWCGTATIVDHVTFRRQSDGILMFVTGAVPD